MIRTVMLMILDGFGINPNREGNAVKQADMKYFNSLLERYPNNYLITSGVKVGLPAGQMGNSEVGHTNIGARKNSISRVTKN